MIEAILWFLAVGLAAVPLWILWRASKNAASLDFRLSQNDASLLEDDRFIVTQMTGLPLGTRVVPNANVVVEQTPQTNGAMPETLA